MLIFIIAPGEHSGKNQPLVLKSNLYSAATSLHQSAIQPEREEACGGCGVDDGDNKGVMGDAVAIGDFACITSCVGGRGRTPMCV